MFVPCVVVWWRWLSDAHLKRLIEYDVCVRVSVCCDVEVVGECASQMTDQYGACTARSRGDETRKGFRNSNQNRKRKSARSCFKSNV